MPVLRVDGRTYGQSNALLRCAALEGVEIFTDISEICAGVSVWLGLIASRTVLVSNTATFHGSNSDSFPQRACRETREPC